MQRILYQTSELINPNITVASGLGITIKSLLDGMGGLNVLFHYHYLFTQ